MSNYPDQKVFSYLLKGAAEFNNLQRLIDIGLLVEAVHYDFKELAVIIKDYYSTYRVPPTFSILKDELITDENMLELVLQIESVDCKDTEVEFYLSKIRKRYNSYLAKILSDAASGEDNFDVEEYNSSLGRIQNKITRLYKSSTFAEGDIQASAEDRLNKYLHLENNPDDIAGVFMGYHDLDELTWGVKKSEMMVIVGGSSSGKSLLMMNCAINSWLNKNNPFEDKAPYEGKNILYFTLEMSKHQLEQRIDSNIGEIVANNIIRGKLSQFEKNNYYKIIDFCKNYPYKFYISDLPRGSRVLDLEARFDSIITEFKPDLVCVDYLGIMKPNVPHNQDWLDTGTVAEELHEFCRRKDIPVITAAQRKAKDKKNKKQFHDLEEISRSKIIGDNANIVLLIEEREEEYLREDMIIHVVKNRSGAKGKFTLLKDFERSKILNLPDNWAGSAGSENAV